MVWKALKNLRLIASGGVLAFELGNVFLLKKRLTGFEKPWNKHPSELPHIMQIVFGVFALHFLQA